MTRRLRRSRAVGAMLAGLVLAGAGAWAAAPASSIERQAKLGGAFFGVNTFPLPLVTDQDVAGIQRGGIRTVRFFINWALVEPSPGSYQWALTDRMMTRLASTRLRALPLVSGVPTWVVPNDHAPTSPSARRSWSRFVRAVVSRYGPNGTFWAANPGLPRDAIRDLQIWNEPNFPSMWGGRVSAKGYARLLKTSAKAVRAVSPDVKVVLAGLAPGLATSNQVPSWKFLTQLYAAGAKPYFDVAADHPYAPDVAAMADQLRRVAKVMRRHHDHSPLYITEVGWSSGNAPGSHLEVGLRGQAKRLRGAVQYVIHHARRFNIKRFVWFQWRDQAPSGPANPEGKFNFGLLRVSGAPKPAGFAYARFTR